jgi:multisubunit Na+/H+ antiporter MnhC subunit
MLKNDLFDNGFKPGDTPFWSWESLSWYFMYMEKYQLYLGLFLMFLVGVFFCLKRDIFRKNVELVVFIAGNYVLFTLMHKDIRYTMPMLVGVSVLSVFWIGRVQSKFSRRLIQALLLLYCGLSFWFMSFGTTLFPEGELNFHGINFFEQKAFYHSLPSKAQWHQEEIFQIISEFPAENRQLACGGLDSQHYNNWGYVYYGLIYGVTVEEEKEKPGFIASRAPKLPAAPKGYKLFKSFDLPDDSKLALFKREKSS